MNSSSKNATIQTRNGSGIYRALFIYHIMTMTSIKSFITPPLFTVQVKYFYNHQSAKEVENSLADLVKVRVRIKLKKKTDNLISCVWLLGLCGRV